VLTCTIGCLRPTVSLVCVANCAAQGCADVQFFVDQAVTCLIQNIDQCSGDIMSCFQRVCRSEFRACLAARC
jgi:hypothetical protein